MTLKRKFWRVLITLLLVPIILLSAVLIYIQTQQESILKNQISELNKQYKGAIEVGKSNLSFFGNFPYISIKIDDVKILEDKTNTSTEIMHVKDIYVGFNLWDILNKNYDVQSIVVEDGVFNIILHKDGSNNLENALKYSNTNTDTTQTALNIHLKKVKLKNLDIHKLDETTNTDIETFIFYGEGGFKKNKQRIDVHVNSEFKLNVIKAHDTTYIKNKYFEFDTDITYNDSSGLLTIAPTNLIMEHADFDLQGTINTKNKMDLDLAVKGTKSNFNTLIAFAPHDLIPVLERYKNAGDIYFNAIVKGKLQDDKIPFIDVNFGTDKAYLENSKKKRKITDLGFSGHFTNGAHRDLESMEFSITNINATLEKGKFKGALIVKNFKHPEVNAQIDANFNIKFITDFFNINNIKNTSGNIDLKMNFHDIIDINQPELALNNLNRAYYSEIKIEDLNIVSEDLPAPLKRLNAHIEMNGKAATINNFDMLFGTSDVSAKGYISNLPAIIHHTNDTITAHLEIQSKLINIAELSQFSAADSTSTGIDEQITDLSAGLSFKAFAKDVTEFKYVPKGEFFIDSLHAQLKHYPHKFHDFHADILVDDADMKIIDFTGFIDDSDFHLNGLAHQYGFWFQETLNGDVEVDLTLTSNLLKLENMFTYKAENYIPDEYRHEAFNNLILRVNTSMHYKNTTLSAIDADLNKLQAKMKLHPNMFEDFSGHFHYEDEHLMVKDFHGKIGATNFDIDLNYYLGNNDSIKKRDNHLGLKANYIDYDALFQFNPSVENPTVAKQDQLKDVAVHTEAFNIYELPFTAMTFNVDVNHFIYHNIDLQNIKGQLKTTPNHYIYIDTFNLDAAGGNFKLSGYFNGSDPKHIYFKPKLSVQNVDIDQLLFKFENFGQDHLVSENLHGKITSEINGNIRVYPDMVPDIDQSEIHMNVKVLEGRLENYEPMEILSDYIGNKNLKNIRFDTLQNKIDINNGKLVIPNMTIESTLGHIEISGTHDNQHNIEYYLKIPWKTAKKAALYKLFGNKKKADSMYSEEAIIKKDTTKRTRYLNIKVDGTIDDYNISLKKKKD